MFGHPHIERWLWDEDLISPIPAVCECGAERNGASWFLGVHELHPQIRRLEELSVARKGKGKVSK